MFELKYRLFDGEKIRNGTVVTVENGIISNIRECDMSECGDGILMPTLIDAHTHTESTAHVSEMLQNGIGVACDVSASGVLAEQSKQLEIVRSAGMAMGIVMNPRAYVEKAVMNGAKYIKVLLFNTFSVGKTALCGIVKVAHGKNLKVAVHTTEIATVKQAVDADADILLHVPMNEKIPSDLAKLIAEKKIAVVPTLVMMETFANSTRKGFKPEDYRNARDNVELLHKCGVTVLAGTDANSGSFAPAVGYGKTLHREMKLLSEAGLTPVEVLSAATLKNAEAFGLNAGKIEVGAPATMTLAKMNIEDGFNIEKIKNVWIKGEQIL